MLILAKLTEEYAREICGWKYENEYSVYNYPDWKTVLEQKWGIADETKRRNEFTAVIDEKSALCGYFRLVVKDKNSVMLGLGLNPQLCGKGLSAKFMELIIGKYEKLYPNRNLELNVGLSIKGQ